MKGRKWRGKEGMGEKEKGNERERRGGTQTPSHISGYGAGLEVNSYVLLLTPTVVE